VGSVYFANFIFAYCPATSDASPIVQFDVAEALTVDDNTDDWQVPDTDPCEALPVNVHEPTPAAVVLHVHVLTVGIVHRAEEPLLITVVVEEVVTETTGAVHWVAGVPHMAFVVDVHVPMLPIAPHVSVHEPAVGNEHEAEELKRAAVFGVAAAVAAFVPEQVVEAARTVHVAPVVFVQTPALPLVGQFIVHVPAEPVHAYEEPKTVRAEVALIMFTDVQLPVGVPQVAPVVLVHVPALPIALQLSVHVPDVPVQLTEEPRKLIVCAPAV